MTAYIPGTVGVCHSTGTLSELIRTGEFLARRHRRWPAWKPSKPPWYWNHGFVIVSETGDTIEAEAAGVVKSHVDSHGDRLLLPLPRGVNGAAVVAFATAALGDPYSIPDDVFLGIDCLTGWRLHDPRTGVYVCSELAAAALIAGGWESPKLPVLTMPADLVWELL